MITYLSSTLCSVEDAECHRGWNYHFITVTGNDYSLKADGFKIAVCVLVVILRSVS